MDGVGNPAHYLRISASAEIPHQSCSPEIAGWIGASIDVSPLYSTQPDYWSKGIVKGEIPIRDTAEPMKITVRGTLEDGTIQERTRERSIMKDYQVEPKTTYL